MVRPLLPVGKGSLGEVWLRLCTNTCSLPPSLLPTTPSSPLPTVLHCCWALHVACCFLALLRCDSASPMLHQGARLLLGIPRSPETHLKYLICISLYMKEIEWNSTISKLSAWWKHRWKSPQSRGEVMFRLGVRFEKLCRVQKRHMAH